VARPTILTDALIADFCSKLRISGSIETAILTTGIGRESYYGWARSVRAGAGSVMARKFIAAVDKAEGETKLIREHALQKHFKTHWQSIAWYLERRFSDEYGQRRPPPIVLRESNGEVHEVERVVWRKAEKPKATVEPPAATEPIGPSGQDSPDGPVGPVGPVTPET
jgi:hypothetical protein